jgi:amino acid adenylation domain-containing protein
MDEPDSLQKGRAKRDAPHSIIGTAGFPESVPDLIAAQAARTPQRTAVAWSGGGAWTYARLMQMADAIARNLTARGVTHGDLVGISVPRRPEMAAAVLGVMRAGAAYVALDPKFPESRLRYMAEHSGIRDVLVWRDNESSAGLPPGCQPLVMEDLDPERIPDVALPRVGGNDLAYVLYTSGSTGQPKGVRILQRNLVNFLTSMRREPGIAVDDVLCAVTTLSFDIAALELYLPLMVGARVVIATEAEQADPTAFSRLLRKHAVTMMQTTPTRLRLLLGSDRANEVRGMKLLVGGEAMPRDLAETILPVCSELWNMYGPTETTVWSTLQLVAHHSGPVPLGKPIADTTLHVLDDARQPVADGAMGEIWIGGAGVADGYLHDPEKTAERFIADPFAADGSHMYRTGDLGSLRDGVLHFHGRIDDQIKLNGFRIEPGEIEAAALAEAGVRQAVAVARDFGDNDERLVLYVVADPDPGLATRLRASLRERLPDYMRPRLIEVLDALPRTPNGKIDRKVLPLPTTIAAGMHATLEVVPDRLESAIAAIWSELLKVRNIGPDEDFFDLGGDSLLAVRVFERMQALTGINLPLSALLTGPTIARQVAIFREAGARESSATTTPSAAAGQEDKWSPLVAIQPRGTRLPLFLIHAIGGNVLNYVPLGRGLGAEQPVYGIQAIGLDGLTPPISSIQTMAACYLAEIQRVQPHGPYFLAGGSMGGLIAYEIAQQLHEQGESTGLLAMMDTHGPGYRHGAFRANLPAPVRMILSPFGSVRRVLDAWQVRRARAAGRPLPHALRHREIERVHYRALIAYHAQRHAGQVLLFRVSEPRRSARHTEALGWEGHVAGGVVVIELPGNHDNLIEQPELLRRLREALEQAQLAAVPR